MSVVLLISPEAWDAPAVSKHHYARELARRGHVVLFHGPPEALDGIALVPAADATGDLLVLRAPRVAPGMRILPPPLRRALEARWLAQVEAALGQSVDVVWNFENSRFYDMDFAGARLKIYHQVDLNQDFHPDIAVASADLSVAISAPIESRLRRRARALIRLTHGHAAPEAILNLPDTSPFDEKAGRDTAHVMLVGNLEMTYLDVPLLAQAVLDHPRARFHFIGPYRTGAGLHGAVRGATNVRFWGQQPSQLLPSLLARADLLLVAYLAGQHLEQLANPHKIMEYLASGRAILATRTLEYEGRSDLMTMAKDRADYARLLAGLLADPATLNPPNAVAHRKAFAANHTYPHQLDRIVQALGPRGVLIA